MSAATIVAELTEIDALPRAKVQSAIGNGDIDTHASDDALGVRRHIVSAFKGVTVVRHILRHKPVVDCLHVSSHIWIPVLTYT